MTSLPRRWLLVLACAATIVCLQPASLHAQPGGAVPWLQASAGSDALAAAAKAEREGRDADAEAGYRAVAASAGAATAARAELALGRFLERCGRASEAEAPLQAAVTALGSAPDGLRARFLLGEAQADQEKSSAAVASFQAYRAGGGPALGYASLEEAWALQAAGDDRTALSVLEALLQAPSLTIRRAAIQSAAESHARLGEPAQAAADQRALVDTRPAAYDAANALLEAGRLYHVAGDDGHAAEAWLAVVQTYPSLPAAGTALDRLDSLGVAVDTLQRGVVLFRLRRNAGAEAVFQSILAGQPDAPLAARVTYYLATIADRRDENDAALAGYAAAYSLDPGGDLAPDALWARAQLLRSLDRYADAQADYTRLAQSFPTGGHAQEAVFSAGLMAYLDGRAGDAQSLWEAAALAATGSDAARLNLWLAKIARARGDTAAASAALTTAQASDPGGYFGLRAEVLAVGGSDPSIDGTALPPLPSADWSSVEAWLAGWAGPEDPAVFQSLQGAQDWSEGIELDALGWKTTPSTLLSTWLDDVHRQPWPLYRAARVFAERGLTHLALQAAGELLDLAPGSRLSAPRTLLQLAYPIDYLEIVNQEAGRNGLDPLLMFALIRQESEFNPVAGSGAGAQGLAQLIPSTAADVAGSLGLAGFTAADLNRPSVNLRLGAFYLAQQARAAGDDLSRTLAAYNAGGGSAARWARQAGSDPDRFYEAVDYSETRLYIRRVSENLAIYNLLYRGANHPTLIAGR